MTTPTNFAGEKRMEARQEATPYYVGAQNDQLYIIAGRAPSPSNDYPVHDADRTVIAKVYDEKSAAFIVRACNAHDDLVATLKEYVADQKTKNAGLKRHLRDATDDLLDRAVSALAKAGAA